MRPTIEDESADLTVYVRVLGDPTGVLWHNFVKCVVANIVLPVCSDAFAATTQRRKLALSD